MKNIVSLLTATFVACSAQAQLVDFNNTGDLAANFDGYASGTQFVNVATGGLSNSGFVSMDPGATDNYAVYQTGVDATAFSGATVGGYFLYDGTTFSSRPLSFGFTSSATDTYSGSTTTDGTDIKMNLLGSGSGTTAGIEIYNNGANVATSSTNVTLTAGNWYYMQLTITGVSGGDFTGVTAQLFDSDSSGTLGATLKDLNNGGPGYTVTSTLTADSSVFGFFGGIGPGSRGIDGVDNFEIDTGANGGGDGSIGFVTLVPGSGTATVNFTLETTEDLANPFTPVDAADIVSVSESGGVISVEFNTGAATQVFLRVDGTN